MNPRLGESYDTVAVMADRPTRPAPLAGAMVGFVLGWFAARARKLELAAALHAGVAKTQLALQHLAETASWAIAAAVLAAVGAALAAGGSLEPRMGLWTFGLRPIAAAAVAAALGSVVGALTARERHLFRYFKDR